MFAFAKILFGKILIFLLLGVFVFRLTEANYYGDIYILENDISFYCTEDIPIQTFMASMFDNGRNLFRDLLYCNTTNCESKFSNFVTFTRSDNPVSIKITVNISNDEGQIRNITQFRCTYNRDKSFIYNVFTVAKPKGNTCEQPKLIENGKNVFVTCTTLQIFPPAQCFFYFKNKTIPGKTEYLHIENSGPTKYFTSVCNWTAPVSYFVADLYTFDVLIVSNITNDTNYGEIVRTNYFLNLTKPVVALSGDCKNGPNIIDGYIKPSATSYCTCILEKIGNPPSIVQWFDNIGMERGAPLNNNASILTIGPSDDFKEFFCIGISSLNNGNASIAHNVSYAFGPLGCHVQPNNTVQKLCGNTSAEIKFTCNIKQSDVKPGAKSMYSVNNNSFSNSTESILVNNTFTSQIETTFKTAGDFKVKCEARNSLFNNVKAECEAVGYIIAPPPLAPNLTITNYIDKYGDVYVVKEREMYNVLCSVIGGTPTASIVAFSCGNITESPQSKNIFSRNISFTRNMTGQNCTCRADHVTQCYYNNNAPIITLNVTYTSSVIKFDIQNTTTIVNNGTAAIFYCEADGNPLPIINILKGNNILNSTINNHISYKKQLFCEDAGNYTCNTNNQVTNIDLKVNQSQTRIIYVQCQFQFYNPADLQSVYNGTSGSEFATNIKIYGYPKPSNFSIIKSDELTTVEIKLLKAEENHYASANSKFLVNYSALEPPYFYVDLKILNLTSFDFANYSLLVFQDEFKELSYNFLIKEANATDVKVELSLSNDNELIAAVGGGIGAAIFVILFAIIVAFIGKQRNSHKLKALFQRDLHNSHFCQFDNIDIYSISVILKVTPNKDTDVKSPYKNFKDVVPTITSATALPKNMYKPGVLPKPKTHSDTEKEYYNYVAPLDSAGSALSDTKQLIDDSIYANQSF